MNVFKLKDEMTVGNAKMRTIASFVANKDILLETVNIVTTSTERGKRSAHNANAIPINSVSPTAVFIKATLGERQQRCLRSENVR